ncbi:zinc finger protein 570-like [Euwallacea fornicatus]|uniref:zinc finger protein 570-like n=1 Tax=Euwallacea fornicatus TaxID=995702 RepID=UPI00338DB86E
MYNCSNCGKGLRYKKSLISHEMRCKGLTFKVKCEVCYKMVDNSNMKYHLWVHRTAAIHECYICHKKFRDKGYLVKHIKYHKGELKYPCDVCGKFYSSKMAADDHKVSAHTKKYEAFCDVCGKGFPSLNRVKHHLSVSHRPEDAPIKLFPCPFEGCNKTFRGHASLNFHLPTHNTEKPLHQCPYCPKTFGHPLSYKRHIKGKHTEEGRLGHTCHICKKVLTSQNGLRDHLRSHTGEKPYSCEVCEKPFKTKGLLRIHSVIHSKVKPYICKVCKKGFTQYGSLKGHFLKMHPEEEWKGTAKEKSS